MRATYQVMRQGKGENAEVVFTSTRKREIESLFNRLMKSFIKDGKFSVESKNIGYAVVTFFGEWGMSDTEYFICKA